MVGSDLNAEIAEHIGRAYGTYMKRQGITELVVGRDCRASGPEYSEALIKGLIYSGANVADIGMTLIGTFYWAQYFLKKRGGVFVSASHNPPEYNGFKFANDFSETLVSEGMQELRRMVEKEDFEKGITLGKIEEQNIIEAYFSDLFKKITLNKAFKVVVDPSNSTAGVIIPDLLRKAGCQVIENNCNLDSSFPVGTPDPTAIDVARRLGERVLKEKADIGFSYDADGDRIGIVDDKGNMILNDVLVALFAIEVLRYHPGATIMYNSLCSEVVEKTIIQHGGKPFMWRTGHSFLKKKNQEIKAAFIGELSGHFFFSADFYNHDDGAYSTLRLLNYLAETNQSLSAAVSSLPKYISSPEIKLFSADEKKVGLIVEIGKVLKNDFLDAEIIDDERVGDGVRINLSDGMFIVRYSQNGPYLTIKFEAKTQDRYDFLKDYIKKLLQSHEEVDWNSKINVNTDSLN